LTGPLKNPIGKRDPEDCREESCYDGRQDRPHLFVGRLYRNRADLYHRNDGPSETLEAEEQGGPSPDLSNRTPLPDQKPCNASGDENRPPERERVPRQPGTGCHNEAAKQGIELRTPPCGDHTGRCSPWGLRG